MVQRDRHVDSDTFREVLSVIELKLKCIINVLEKLQEKTEREKYRRRKNNTKKREARQREQNKSLRREK